MVESMLRNSKAALSYRSDVSEEAEWEDKDCDQHHLNGDICKPSRGVNIMP